MESGRLGNMSQVSVDSQMWEKMSERAWESHSNAKVLGTTKVGAAVVSEEGKIFSGCNIEHKFRSHDIHAEVSAISSLVSSGCKSLSAILVVAERKQFTPCGSCMDWIFELGGPECVVGYQNQKGGHVKKFLARDLMPHYPI